MAGNQTKDILRAFTSIANQYGGWDAMDERYKEIFDSIASDVPVYVDDFNEESGVDIFIVGDKVKVVDWQENYWTNEEGLMGTPWKVTDFPACSEANLDESSGLLSQNPYYREDMENYPDDYMDPEVYEVKGFDVDGDIVIYSRKYDEHYLINRDGLEKVRPGEPVSPILDEDLFRI